MSSTSSMLGLLGFLLASFTAAAVGSIAGAWGRPEWYEHLAKPAALPPDWVFSIVWTLLYVAIAVAAWLVWREAGWRLGRAALMLFFVQLGLNAAWSLIFFAGHAIGWALVEIVVLWLAVALTTAAFWQISWPAGVLMLAYLAWVSFAVFLNARIWWLN